MLIALSVVPIAEQLVDAEISLSGCPVTNSGSVDKKELQPKHKNIPFELIQGMKPPQRTNLEATERKISTWFRVSKESAALVSWQSLMYP